MQATENNGSLMFQCGRIHISIMCIVIRIVQAVLDSLFLNQTENQLFQTEYNFSEKSQSILVSPNISAKTDLSVCYHVDGPLENSQAVHIKTHHSYSSSALVLDQDCSENGQSLVTNIFLENTCASGTTITALSAQLSPFYHVPISVLVSQALELSSAAFSSLLRKKIQKYFFDTQTRI